MKKNPFKDKILICDMDGTLLNSKHKISKENINAICRFVEGGGLFSVATGRMEKAVEQYLTDLPINLPAIIYNGAAIYDFTNKKMLWQNYMHESAEALAEKIYNRFPSLGIEVFQGGEIYVVRQNDKIENHISREKLKHKEAYFYDIPKPWFKVLMAEEPEKLKEVEEYLEGIEKPFRTVYSEPIFLELLNSSVSKGYALKQLAAMIKYPCECITAMGDNFNDIELIETAGTGIAVGNANGALKEVADLCCSHNDRHPVAEVINWIEEGIVKNLAVV